MAGSNGKVEAWINMYKFMFKTCFSKSAVMGFALELKNALPF